MDKFKKLSNNQMSTVKGGFRLVHKIDLDADGEWDLKLVTNTRTGANKFKMRAN